MKYQAVCFDLFGTIVAPFRRVEHEEAIRACSDELGVTFDDCHHHWVTTFTQRISGRFGSVAENLRWIVEQCGCHTSPERLMRAEELYGDFTRQGLLPIEGAIETLTGLKSVGVRVALVTNCAPDVPNHWSHSEFAPYFDHCAFSCHVGATKPSPAIYEAALTALDVGPSSVLYVGDGSDRELSGAMSVGMDAVLVRRDLANTYDRNRADVDDWTGMTIADLREVLTLVGAVGPAG